MLVCISYSSECWITYASNQVSLNLHKELQLREIMLAKANNLLYIDLLTSTLHYNYVLFHTYEARVLVHIFFCIIFSLFIFFFTYNLFNT